MRKDSKDLTEIFSVGSNDSNPSIKEIRRKKTDKNSSSDIATYEVVAHIEKNQEIKIEDKSLSPAEIDFIQHQFGR